LAWSKSRKKRNNVRAAQNKRNCNEIMMMLLNYLGLWPTNLISANFFSPDVHPGDDDDHDRDDDDDDDDANDDDDHDYHSFCTTVS